VWGGGRWICNEELVKLLINDTQRPRYILSLSIANMTQTLFNWVWLNCTYLSRSTLGFKKGNGRIALGRKTGSGRTALELKKCNPTKISCI